MTTEPHQPSMATIQANIARIAKNSQNKRPRDWMLYVFFRVMKQSEVDLTKALLLNLINSLAEKGGIYNEQLFIELFLQVDSIVNSFFYYFYAIYIT